MKTIKTLLVDDDPEILEILHECVKGCFMNQADCDTSRAFNGNEALGQLSVEKFDLIVTDLKMPECTGTEMVQQLRGNPGINRYTPVLIVSGYLSSERQSDNIDNVFFMAKPFEFERVMRMLRMIMALNRPVSYS